MMFDLQMCDIFTDYFASKVITVVCVFLSFLLLKPQGLILFTKIIALFGIVQVNLTLLSLSAIILLQLRK